MVIILGRLGYAEVRRVVSFLRMQELVQVNCC
jgi:hypothetical protein